MRLTISRRSAAWAFFAAAAARLFLALAVDAPTTHNGAWLSALLGGALAAPVALCMDQTDIAEGGGVGAGTLPLALTSLVGATLEAAACARAIARSAGYLALNRVPTFALIAPAGLAALWCAWRDGDAIGRGAMAWARIFPLLLAIIVALQARHYRPEWLAPALGSGWRSVVVGGVGAAGGVASVASILLTAPSPAKRRECRAIYWPLAGCALIAAGLLTLRQMMTPTLIGVDGWISRLDTLLTNGRAPLYLQLPMIAAWYAGLMHLLACACFASAALLQRLTPRLDGRLCAGISTVAACVAAASAPVGEITARMRPWMGVALALCAMAAALSRARAEGRSGACAG